MALPKQVQQQLEQAEQIERQLVEGQPPEADTGEQPPPTPQPEPQVAAAPVATPPPAEAGEQWEQRFKSLKGRFDAEVPRLHQAVKERDAKLGALEQEVARLKTPAQPQQPKAESLVTTQDDEKFGSDLIELMRRVVREGTSSVSQRLDAIEGIVREHAPRVHQVQQVADEVAQAKADRFYSELNAAVPDWQDINADQKWLDWLNVHDPIAGCTRQAALDVASGMLDYARVIALFRLYKAQTATPTPPQKPSQNPELARQVAPAKSARTSVPPQGEKTYTGAQYEYWNDPRRYHDTPRDRVAAMQVELEHALAEGRIKFS